MSNRFKFRVWDKDRNRMYFSDFMTTYENEFGYSVLECEFDYHACNDGFGKNIVIQQFTGLKDKKGNDIYEGDIVLENMTEEMAAEGVTSSIGQIIFAAGTFMIDSDGPLWEHTFSLTPDILEDYIVVGNIFENRELLE
jgi:uncharacterized phage protein (TIGR01671 family)